MANEQDTKSLSESMVEWMKLQHQMNDAISRLNIQKPCPSCGHCPTCGRSRSVQPWQTWPWYQKQPWYTTHQQWTSGITGVDTTNESTICHQAYRDPEAAE